MDDLLERGTRCPHCRAAVRPDAPWCSLCHADLRPPPPPPPAAVLPPAPPVVLAAPAAPFDPLTAPAALLGLPASARSSAAALEALAAQRSAPPDTTTRAADPADDPAVVTWPCTACGTPTPLTAAACSACGTGFLAGLRDTEGPLLELPLVGDLTKLPRSSRMLLALGVVLIVAAVTALLGLLLS